MIILKLEVISTIAMIRYGLFIIAFAVMLAFSSAAMAERLSVSISVANIHSGPGNDHGILFKAQQYYPVFVLEKTDHWFRFRNYEGDEGWIHQSSVAKIPTVITKNAKCNIRTGPAPSRNISATVGKGISFKIIKREGEWLNIQHAGGFIGWIHKSLVW